MLALMVLLLLVMDALMLVIFSLVEGAKGDLGARAFLDKEHDNEIHGVSVQYMEVYLEEEKKTFYFTSKNVMNET